MTPRDQMIEGARRAIQLAIGEVEMVQRLSDADDVTYSVAHQLLVEARQWFEQVTPPAEKS